MNTHLSSWLRRSVHFALAGALFGLPALVVAEVSLDYVPQSGKVVSASGLKANFDKLTAAVNAPALPPSAFVRRQDCLVHALSGGVVVNDCPCRRDEILISGGASCPVGAALKESKQLNDEPTWRSVCFEANGRYVAAEGAQVLCLKVADQ